MTVLCAWTKVYFLVWFPLLSHIVWISHGYSAFWGLLLQMSMLVTLMYWAKTAKPTEVLTMGLTLVGPRNHVLDGTEIPMEKRNSGGCRRREKFWDSLHGIVSIRDHWVVTNRILQKGSFNPQYAKWLLSNFSDHTCSFYDKTHPGKCKIPVN